MEQGSNLINLLRRELVPQPCDGAARKEKVVPGMHEMCPALRNDSNGRLTPIGQRFS